MKNLTLVRLLSAAAVASALVVASSVKADTLAQWTFETSGPSIVGTSAAFSPIVPETLFSGATAAGSGTHAGATTVWSHPAGDGSLYSFSANLWAQADYFQFTLTPDLVDYSYSAINVAYDQNGSATGPGHFYFEYSVNGSTWTQVGSDYALTSGVTWSTGVSGAATHESFDLSAITALNTASTMYFRIVDDSVTVGGAVNGGNVGTGGTDRLDNFSITASVTAIPEPTSMVLLGTFGSFLAWNLIRRRK